MRVVVDAYSGAEREGFIPCRGLPGKKRNDSSREISAASENHPRLCSRRQIVLSVLHGQ